MNKQQLITQIAQRAEIDRKTVAKILDSLTTAIVTEVARGGKVTITGFGSFEQVHRPARTGRNPKTGERIQIQAKDVPTFKPGSDFRTAVNGGLPLVAA